MLSAAAAPAPSAMHRIAVKPSTGWIGAGATSRPHRPVKTTSVITRGLVSARKSRQSAGRALGRGRCHIRPGAVGSVKIRLAERCGILAQSTFGSVSNWWKGGGLDSVHSSVVAPSPHGLSGAFLPATSDQKMLTKKKTMPTAIRM